MIAFLVIVSCMNWQQILARVSSSLFPAGNAKAFASHEKASDAYCGQELLSVLSGIDRLDGRRGLLVLSRKKLAQAQLPSSTRSFNAGNRVKPSNPLIPGDLTRSANLRGPACL